jgi:hypothetical protein
MKNEMPAINTSAPIAITTALDPLKELSPLVVVGLTMTGLVVVVGVVA